MVMFGSDFAPLAAGPQAARRGPEALALDRGVKRSWLKVFETPPVQMLNAYGEAKYARFGNADLWQNMTKPLKSGAEYMTEFASSEAERRGTAANRWLHAQLSYLNHQLTVPVRTQNECLSDPPGCRVLLGAPQSP